MRLILLALLPLIATAAPSAAQPAAPRVIAVPAAASWQHAETQMILPSQAAGLARGEIRDLGAGEMDVVIPYENEGEGLIATVYLYRTMAPYLPVWFDRSQAMIMLRPEYGVEGAAAPTPVAFARPGATVASGLRAALDLPGPDLRSTAVAIAPLGANWLLKVRFSSARLDRAALDERLTAFLQALRWPAETGRPVAATPVVPCARPLNLRTARVIRSEDAQANGLMDAVLAGVVAEHQEGPPPAYCREPGATIQRGVYRANESTDAYLIALDAGIALALGSAMDLSALLGGGGGGNRFSMTLLGREGSSVYPSFNRLPPVDQALSVFGGAGPVLSVTTRDPQPEAPQPPK
jgi:hypothetical protein